MIPLSKPSITKLEQELVAKAMQSDQLSMGPMLKRFERMLTNYIRAGGRLRLCDVVVVNSGTAALHIQMLIHGVDRCMAVFATSFSFIASANCLRYVGAEPIFIDIDPHTYNIDPIKLEEACIANPHVRHLVLVHVFGYPCDMVEIKRICQKYKVAIIEDSCEALGSTSNGVKIGAHGSGGTLAFYPNKQVTTGEGGAVITQMPATADALRNQGRYRSTSFHELLGYNYRMPEINAALGVAQMLRIDEILEKRRRVDTYYRESLDFNYIDPLAAAQGGDVFSRFVMVVKLKNENLSKMTHQIIQQLNNKGIQSKNYFYPIHLQPIYRRPGGYDLPITEQVGTRTIALPYFTDMTKEQVERVCENFNNICKKMLDIL